MPGRFVIEPGRRIARVPRNLAARGSTNCLAFAGLQVRLSVVRHIRGLQDSDRDNREKTCSQ